MTKYQTVYLLFHILFGQPDSIDLPYSTSSLHLLLFYSHALLLQLMLNELQNLPCIFHNQGQMRILLIHLFLPLFNLPFIFLIQPMLAFYFSSIALIFSQSQIPFYIVALIVVGFEILFNCFLYFLGYFIMIVSFSASQKLLANFVLLNFLIHFLPKLLHVLYFFQF